MKGVIVKKAIKLHGFTQSDIAAAIGISREHLTRMLMSDIDELYVEKIRGLGIKIENVIKSDEVKPVPYYDIDAHAGNVEIFAEDRPEYVKQYISVPAFSDCDMFLNVSGNSMYPKYCSGELVALKKITDFEVVPFNEAYLIVTKEHRLLKYIRKSSIKDNWMLCSENQVHEPMELPIKKVLHLYMVKGKIAKNVI